MTTIFVVNFNTTELTNICLKSIIKHTKFPYHIVLLDNSTHIKFSLDNEITCPITIVDNTNDSLIDYKKIKELFCKTPNIADHASLKHSVAIEWMIQNCRTQDLLLIDSDAILQKDIDFIDDNFATIAQVKAEFGVPRFVPIVQYINVNSIRKHHISYFDPARMHGGINPENDKYDTGAAFYENILNAKMPYKQIIFDEYVYHTGGFSWKQCAYGYEHYLAKLEKFKAELEFRGIV